MVEQSKYNKHKSRSYRTVKRLAPDARIYVNGGFELKCPKCSAFHIPENDITQVSVSNQIDSSPSSASFSVSAPSHEPLRYFDKGHFYITTLMEIKIFMKGRFKKQTKYGEEYPYYPVFWGVVTSVQHSYSNGISTLSVECSDMLRWWEITKANINPTCTQLYMIPGISATAYTQMFENMTAVEIILWLKDVTMYSALSPADMLGQNAGNGPGSVQDIINFQRASSELIDYWKQRMTTVGASLMILGYDMKEVDKPFRKWNPKHMSLENIKAMRTKANMSILGGRFAVPDEFSPYGQVGNISLFGNNTKSYLEIAKEVAGMIDYELFQDTTGHILFKPHFYNMNVKHFPDWVIEDLDIVTSSFIENEAEIVTACDVKGSWVSQQEHSAEEYSVPHARFTDWTLARKYGIRTQSRDAYWLRTYQGCYAYAINEVDKQNAKRFQGSLQIMGRPEIRLGFPVYIKEMDLFCYVTGLTHDFTFGETFKTTISFKAIRRKYVPADKKLSPENIVLKIENEIVVNTREDITRPLEEDYIRTLQEKETYEPKVFNGKVAPGEKKTGIDQEYKKFDEKTQNYLTFTNKASDSEFVNYNAIMDEYQIEKMKYQRDEEILWVTEFGKYKEKTEKNFFKNYNSTKLIEELLHTLPASDHIGYELVGTWPYGAYIDLDETGSFIREVSYEEASVYIEEKIDPLEVIHKDMALGIQYMSADDGEFKLPLPPKQAFLVEDEVHLANAGISIRDMSPYNASVGAEMEECICDIFKADKRTE